MRTKVMQFQQCATLLQERTLGSTRVEDFQGWRVAMDNIHILFAGLIAIHQLLEAFSVS